MIRTRYFVAERAAKSLNADRNRNKVSKNKYLVIKSRTGFAEFNPEYHEAMSMQEREDVPPNTVVTVMQKGYTLHGRLIRPAMVIVAKAVG